MTAAVLANPIDLFVLRRQRTADRGTPFVESDAFEGPPSEPLYLHKYMFGGANPVAHVDPSGNVFTYSGALTVAGIGAGLGALGTGVAHYALGQAITLKAVLEGAAYGAVFGLAAAAVPVIGIGLGIAGLVSSGLISYKVFTDPDATTGQKVASVTLIVASVYGVAKAFQYHSFVRGFEPEATITINRAFVEFNVNPRGAITKIESHLNRLGEAYGTKGIDPPEAAMLAKLKAGDTSAETKAWARHELAEVRMTEGMQRHGAKTFQDAQEAAHVRIVAHEQANGISVFQRYTADVVARFRKYFPLSHTQNQ